MQTIDFDYNLPQGLIAQHPATPRDHSRLMVIDKNKQTVAHRHFYDVVDFLKKGDLLVWNNSKVFKARLFGRLEAGDRDANRDGIPDKSLLDQQEVEIFLVRPMENEGVWKVLGRPGRRIKPGMVVRFAPDFFCEVIVKERGGDILVQFLDDEAIVRDKANKYGHIPVPPYVKDEPDQLEIYQTVYANENKEGSVAVPTAGFHFTPELIQKLKSKGVEFAEVTLHVGLGTFLPVKSERVEDHTMHSEWVEVSEDCVKKINLAKMEGRRVIAVGTTTVRTLEGTAEIAIRAYEESHLFKKKGKLVNSNWKLDIRERGSLTSKDLPITSYQLLKSYTGDINIFIKPGFEFKVVDAMITNFHLPKSTLLMLVSAFVGDREFMLGCYKKAVEEKYRFYSFGDAMFIYG